MKQFIGKHSFYFAVTAVTLSKSLFSFSIVHIEGPWHSSKGFALHQSECDLLYLSQESKIILKYFFKQCNTLSNIFKLINC